jgi:DnaJ-domain-containing protein 1
VRLDATDERLLSAVDAGLAWAALLQAAPCAPDEAEGRLLRLCALGVLEGKPGAASPNEEPFEDQPTYPFLRSLPPPAATATRSLRSPAATPSKLPGLCPEIVAQLRAVDQLLARLDSASYYELLGVRRDADGRQIRKAYFALSKRFHPDAYFRKPIGDYARKLARVFAALTDAYDTLRSQHRRAAYDADLTVAADLA